MNEDACMKDNDKTKPLYMKMDASGAAQGVTLIQTQEAILAHPEMKLWTTTYSDPLYLPAQA